MVELSLAPLSIQAQIGRVNHMQVFLLLYTSLYKLSYQENHLHSRSR
jgi:hypothetical protein